MWWLCVLTTGHLSTLSLIYHLCNVVHYTSQQLRCLKLPPLWYQSYHLQLWYIACTLEALYSEALNIRGKLPMETNAGALWCRCKRSPCAKPSHSLMFSAEEQTPVIVSYSHTVFMLQQTPGLRDMPQWDRTGLPLWPASALHGGWARRCLQGLGASLLHQTDCGTQAPVPVEPSSTAVTQKHV